MGRELTLPSKGWAVLTVSKSQMETISVAAEQESIQRIDAWLDGLMPEWKPVKPAVRQQTITELLARGDAINLVAEGDLALFVWLGVTKGAAFPEFLAEPDVRLVTAWQTPNRGAVLRELYRLAGCDINPIAEHV